MYFCKILSDKGTNLRKLNHKKHVSSQTIHSTELAFELRHLRAFRKLKAENKETHSKTPFNTYVEHFLHLQYRVDVN